MSSLFQEMEEFTLFDGLVPSHRLQDFNPVVEDHLELGFEIPGDCQVKNGFGTEDLFQDLLSVDSLEDDNWMETTDLSSLLETTQPVKEDAKPTSLLLEELLKNPIKIKSSPPVSDSLKYETIKSEKSPTATSSIISASISKDITLEVDKNDDFEGVDSLLLQQQLYELYEATVSSDFDTSEEASINMISDNSFLDSSSDLFSSPLSHEDIDSILSGSEPASPTDTLEDDPDYQPYISDDTCNSVKKNKRNRGGKASSAKAKIQPSTPYDKSADKLDKKERKRIQNRNAAIRYREKKRELKGNIHQEEDVLSSRNRELKTKVEHLTNEISYMKNLLVEVCEARGLKIEFK